MPLQMMVGVLSGAALYFVLADAVGLPYYKTSRAVANLSKRQREKSSGLEIWLKGAAMFLAKHLRINEFKRAQMEADLRTAQLDVTPEMYRANAVVKAGIVGVLAIQAALFMPILSPVVMILAFGVYHRESKAISRRIKARREKIENELPRLVGNIEKTLKHSRDTLYMLESYSPTAGPELRHELTVTAADMRSGNYEAAITRLEGRIGSSMMSDVCRGLISVLRGDETVLYWSSLAMKFGEFQRQQLRRQAMKTPRKVRRLSLCLLLCFMLIYFVVILSQIMGSLGLLFGR